MKTLTLCTWNVEHLDRLIGNDLSENRNIRREAIAEEITQIDPDILCLVEGPGSEEEIDFFTTQILKRQYSAIKRPEGESYGILGNQWIWFLVKNELVNNCSLLPIDTWHEFTNGKSWEVNYWGNFESQKHKHYRLPQVLVFDLDGQRVEFIGVHFKSKYVNRGKSLWDGTKQEREEFIQEALKARIKLATEAIDVRRYIDTKFTQLEKPAIFVLGDMNDGPGKEYFENSFLFFDLISNIQGDIFSADKFLNHGLFDYPSDLRWTVKFDDFVTGEKNKKILLDHILFTQALVNDNLPSITVKPHAGKVEHEIHDLINSRLNNQQKTSDHKPVTLTISILD